MDLHIAWLPPHPLRDGYRERLTYTLDDLDDLPDSPGVYIFGRRHGDTFAPVYIGKALDLYRRIRQQLNNNRLMNALWDAPTGERQLLVGELVAKPGQRAERAIKIVERGLIKLALAQGHEIVNVQGARLHSHDIAMTGNRATRSWLPGSQLQFE